MLSQDHLRVDVVTHESLGFGRCRLAVAVHRDASYQSGVDLSGKVVGTSFVNLAREWLGRARATCT